MYKNTLLFQKLQEQIFDRNTNFLMYSSGMKLILFLLIFFISSGIQAADSKETPIEVFKKQRILQGEMHFLKAQEYYQNRNFKASSEKVLDFLLIYPDHPQTLSSLKLLSDSYFMDDQLEKSIQVDLKIYRENPMIEEGLISYFQAAKKYVKLGRKEDAVDMFLFITRQMYSKKIAKDAEIELEQIKILDVENPMLEK